jgi:endonuclease/exonuclease/phosphatase family protein
MAKACAWAIGLAVVGGWLVMAGCGGGGSIDEPLPGGGSLTVIGFNVESGDANPLVIASQMKLVQGEALWGLCEVESESWAETFRVAAGQGENADFKAILGTTGGADRLLILYDARVLEERRHFELSDINIGGNVRAPLVGDFRVRATGLELLFMVNHLYRSRDDRRHEQARLLNEWGKRQSLPVIAVGDYNFDWDVQDGEHNHDQGYDLMTAAGVFRWVRPAKLVKTECSASFDSVLDFVFVAGPAQGWAGVSDILSPEASYCPDTDQKSDHRPVRAMFEP